MTTYTSLPRTAWAIFLLLPAILALFNLRPVAASTNETDVTTATIILTPAADSTIDQLKPTANYGTQDTLVVSLAAATPVETAGLLYFELKGIPAGAIITKAELRLYQLGAPATEAQIDIEHLDQIWDEATVTWETQPKFSLVYSDLRVPAGGGQRIPFDVTTLVQSRLHAPSPQQNYGLRLAPSGIPLDRSFSSSESVQPPQLYIEYTPLPSLLTVPQGATEPKLDGACDRTEYAGAAVYRYGDVDGGVRPLYLLHTLDALFVCVEGVGARTHFPARFFALYLDTDLAGDAANNQLPNADDFSLRITVADSVQTIYQGTGGSPTGPYGPDDSVSPDDNFGSWGASAAIDDQTGTESAEYRIPHSTLSAAMPACGATFGLGVFHQSVRTLNDDAGWPLIGSTSGPARPDSWMPARLANPNCPIRVCLEDAVDCAPPDPAALALRTGDGQAFTVDAAGYVQNRAAIGAGNQLWALHPAQTGDRSTLYYTSGAPQTVSPTAFQGAPPGVMTLVVRAQHPLIVHDLIVATQWTLTPAERDHFEQQIVKASDFLYRFTDGQFALGEVTVYQNYEQWSAADLWTYANNNLRPKATAGGIVEAPLDDPNPANALTYYPGYVHMGRYWNRYQAPEGEPIIFEGQPVDPSALTDDWSIAFAHELGHYLLFLFDTYFDVGTDETIVSVDSCVGSAMGWVYETENWGFVHDPGQWVANCANTHANQLLGREEWATIRLHYLDLVTPTAFVEGPDQPPTQLTQVTFIAPGVPGNAYADQSFDLLYANGETASRKSLAYLLRDDRVIAQGNVPKGGTQISLVGAQPGDRFCVYDIDAAPPAPDTPRHQYGCEILQDPSDHQLTMERTPAWRPIVLVDPLSETAITISVEQPLGNNVPMVAQVFPEHLSGSTGVNLVKAGNVYTGVVELGASTPSAYVQVYVDEAADEDDPATDPRREAMAMYGVDGGTVPGPSPWNQKAPVYSSDGSAIAWPTEAIQVAAGQWVSMQYMVETYPTPSGSTRLSDAYRVISWPPSLIQQTVVSVAVKPLPTPLSAAALTPEAIRQTDPLLIRYWTGGGWQAVPTNIVPGQDGKLLASAVLPGKVVFAVFSGRERRYLPTAFE